MTKQIDDKLIEKIFDVSKLMHQLTMVSSKEDLDNLFNAVLADTEALEDAKMTLEVIKKTNLH